ncbi:alpha/beta fold hydrolase [Nocardia sp. alder85J]|uniref:alpha/beta fold hydrolase n=1 Tax=Nocardia sp. alder85J TaxID=2862949 RepID=UPI001CD3FDCF|nr:alpha/beta hydrolase [Nocardia sp. alder85J]MCX4091900.1 alpha/beta hydrolase [Nocardia sp. alder85J]
MTSNITAPPIGGFQEIDGRRLFVHRVGSGGPVVVFLPGAGAVGLDYFAVQQGVSRFGTAVVYDRGGTGYSDPVPLPRNAAAVAGELRELLLAQDLAGPYLLVAHSLGGAYAHRFAQLYPSEVAGLVWVDGFHRDHADFMLAAGQAPAPDPALIRPVLRAMYAELLADYPLHLRQPLIDAHAGDDWLRAGAAERSSVGALVTELRAGRDIPDVPVVALTTAGVDPGPSAAMPEQAIRVIHEGMRAMATALVSAVSAGEHRVVSGVGHHQVCCTRADVVVQAIRDVADRAVGDIADQAMRA